MFSFVGFSFFFLLAVAQANPVRVWIGGNFLVPDWGVTGEDFCFENWNDDEPNNSGGNVGVSVILKLKILQKPPPPPFIFSPFLSFFSSL